MTISFILQMSHTDENPTFDDIYENEKEFYTDESEDKPVAKSVSPQKLLQFVNPFSDLFHAAISVSGDLGVLSLVGSRKCSFECDGSQMLSDLQASIFQLVF